ncbi:MAG: LPS assembly lipoprotein LptE [Verrucomicrobiota bacterium]
MTPRHRGFLLLLSLFLSLGGCAGYQLGHTKPSAYADIRNIHVPTFVNDTQEPRFAVLVTNAVISALQQDGTFRVTDRAKADAILEGKITNNIKQQQRSVDNNILRTRELRSLTQVQYTLQAASGDRLNRENPYGVDVNDVDVSTGQRNVNGLVTGSSTIFLDDNFQLSERQSLTLAAEDAAKKIVDQLSNGW